MSVRDEIDKVIAEMNVRVDEMRVRRHDNYEKLRADAQEMYVVLQAIGDSDLESPSKVAEETIKKCSNPYD